MILTHDIERDRGKRGGGEGDAKITGYHKFLCNAGIWAG